MSRSSDGADGRCDVKREAQPVLRQAVHAVTDVRRVRIPLPIGELVVRAVVGHPGDHGALDRHRIEDREDVADRRPRLERPMREQAVEAALLMVCAGRRGRARTEAG